MSGTTNDLEPGISAVLDRKARLSKDAPYLPRRTRQVGGALRRFLEGHGVEGRVARVRRLPGGGSKEQFVFELERGAGAATTHVLRMDPDQAAVETSRQREFEVLRAYRDLVPVPEAEWVDPDGAVFGQPALVMSFVRGVTRPSGNRGGNVSGMGNVLGPELRDALAEQFLDHLAAIHLSNWRSLSLPSFQAPTADPHQAARWQANWWARVWREDRAHALPVAAVIEEWLQANLPSCEQCVMVHADYRNGNFLFDEATQRIVALLDWELAHLGDFHEDLAWIMQPVLGTVEDGRFYACGLIPGDELIQRYTARTGFLVNPRTLRFYDVLVRYKNFVLTLATCIRAAQWHHNHQDAHATWVAAVGHFFQAEITQLLKKEYGFA